MYMIHLSEPQRDMIVSNILQRHQNELYLLLSILKSLLPQFVNISMIKPMVLDIMSVFVTFSLWPAAANKTNPPPNWLVCDRMIRGRVPYTNDGYFLTGTHSESY